MIATMVLCLAVVPACRLVSQDTIPAGFGALRRDDIMVQFSTPNVQIQVLPLDEQVIRLLAPDTYRSLHQLVQSRFDDIAEAASRAAVDRATLFMVTFLGVVPQARFSPEDLSITSRGRLFRPVAIVPLSPTWSSFQLDARQQAAAIYLFDPGISLREQVIISYQGLNNSNWDRSIRLLDQERARVKARAQVASDTSRGP